MFVGPQNSSLGKGGWCEATVTVQGQETQVMHQGGMSRPAVV